MDKAQVALRLGKLVSSIWSCLLDNNMIVRYGLDTRQTACVQDVLV